MESVILIIQPISKKELKEIARKRFGDLVKAVVDIEKGVMSIGADLHADEEAFLLKEGSDQKNLWGINLYPDLEIPEMIEFDSVINIRPSQGNRSRLVENEEIRQKILEIVKNLII